MGRLKPDATLANTLDVVFRQALTNAAGSRLMPQMEQQIWGQRIDLKPGLRGNAGLAEQFGAKLRILMAVVGMAVLIAPQRRQHAAGAVRDATQGDHGAFGPSERPASS